MMPTSGSLSHVLVCHQLVGRWAGEGEGVRVGEGG